MAQNRPIHIIRYANRWLWLETPIHVMSARSNVVSTDTVQIHNPGGLRNLKF
jgi:hypothetical protein